eukprot:1148910-Pelagomonas_calceolata.AAC.6
MWFKQAPATTGLKAHARSHLNCLVRQGTLTGDAMQLYMLKCATNTRDVQFHGLRLKVAWRVVQQASRKLLATRKTFHHPQIFCDGKKRSKRVLNGFILPSSGLLVTFKRTSLAEFCQGVKFDERQF